MILNFVIAIAVIGLDQLTKFLIYGSPSRSIIGNLLWFDSTLNTGVAFSMFQGKSYIFVITSLVASVFFVYLIISKKWLKSKMQKISLALIVGGTIGNVIDRIIFNWVRDFIYLKFINFAIFNIADMAITFGTILFCFALIFTKDKREEE